ncbi:MAG: APC family permease [Alicyclobacillus sp.]|nr:APC family permease [Alicyclobacillus sp.]
MGEAKAPVRLRRALGVAGNVAIVVSGITPTASVFVIVPAILGITGTGVVWSFLIATVVAFGMGLCDAELGSLYPIAGGSYSLVANVLGRYVGFMATADIVVQSVFLPASIALGDGIYLHSFFPGIDPSWVGFLVMIVTSLIAVLPISANSYLTGVFLALEIVVLALISVFGFTHVHQGWHVLFGAPTGVEGGTNLVPLSTGVLLAGVVTALFSYNGYDSAIVFSEETRGHRKAIAYAVLAALGITVVTELVPVIAVMLGSPDIANLLTSSTPISYMITSLMGQSWNTTVIIGVMLAIFNATIAINLNFGRILYSTARDAAWPPALNRWLLRLHPRWQTPWVATLAVGVVGGLLCFASKFLLLITFTSVLIVVMYALVAISALVSRVRSRRNGDVLPYRMPLWPVPPVVALLGIIVALTQQSHKDLLIALAIFLAASGYYWAYLRRRPYLPQAGQPMADPSERAGMRA